jgi:hypothetical protein
VRNRLRCGLAGASRILRFRMRLGANFGCLRRLKTDAASFMGSREATAEQVPHGLTPTAAVYAGIRDWVSWGLEPGTTRKLVVFGMQLYR